MGKLITKACWIILLLYLQLFNTNAEVERQFRAIIIEKPTPCMQRRTIRKSLKPVLCCKNSSAAHRLILSGDDETNPGLANRDNQQTKPKSDRLRSSTFHICNRTVRINSKKLMCIHCKSMVNLQCSTLKATLVIRILVKFMNGYVKAVVSKNSLSQESVNFMRLLQHHQ